MILSLLGMIPYRYIGLIAFLYLVRVNATTAQSRQASAAWKCLCSMLNPAKTPVSSRLAETMQVDELSQSQHRRLTDTPLRYPHRRAPLSAQPAPPGLHPEPAASCACARGRYARAFPHRARASRTTGRTGPGATERNRSGPKRLVAARITTPFSSSIPSSSVSIWLTTRSVTLAG